MEGRNDTNAKSNASAPQDVPTCDPTDEEERPFFFRKPENTSIVGFSFSDKKPPSRINTEDIQTQRYRSAMTITMVSIGLVVLVWLLDMIASGLSITIGDATFKFATTHTTSVIDLLKYVITASLSFYFGTTANKK